MSPHPTEQGKFVDEILLAQGNKRGLIDGEVAKLEHLGPRACLGYRLVGRGIGRLFLSVLQLQEERCGFILPLEIAIMRTLIAFD